MIFRERYSGYSTGEVHCAICRLEVILQEGDTGKRNRAKNWVRKYYVCAAGTHAYPSLAWTVPTALLLSWHSLYMEMQGSRFREEGAMPRLSTSAQIASVAMDRNGQT